MLLLLILLLLLLPIAAIHSLITPFGFAQGLSLSNGDHRETPFPLGARKARRSRFYKRSNNVAEHERKKNCTDDCEE